MHVPPTVVRAGLRGVRPLFESDRVSIATKRRLVDAFSGAARPPRGSVFDRTEIAGVGVERVRGDWSSTATLIYLHGGGYALGSAHGYRKFAARLAQQAHMDALVPDYSRAPDAPFPVALEEMEALWGTLLADGLDPQRTVVVGDSAGGGLALALAMRLRDRSAPGPAGLGLICPWADLAVDVDSARRARRDPLITPALTAEWSLPYVGSADPQRPEISPVHGDLAGLPPVIMHSAGDDPIAADAERLEEKWPTGPDAAELIHRRHADLWHVFHLQTGFLRAADDAVAELGAALRQFV